MPHILAAGAVLAVTGLLLSRCGQEQAPDSGRLFELMSASETNIDFVNELGYAYEFNIYRYRNFYNGGGVALGDVNNDGFLDVYFVGNQVPNRLYLNDGDFSFTDVTSRAGVAGTRAWSTGVSMVDVNGDGWLDIYVCNSGIVEGDDKKNELYVNNGDSTFTEMAEQYGIADAGLSIHGSFFDYDRDGDLDLYLVNNSYRNIGSFNLRDNTRHIRHAAGGDRLYQNALLSEPGGRASAKGEGAPHFRDVSEQARIYGSEIGFGLGASVGDVNRDGWPDVYVSNDFFERDYLYLNNQDGTFSESLEHSIRSVSAAAMGADMADLNGDGYPEIFVTDMLPKEERRLKTVTSFDTWERYQNYIQDDYYHQFTRNTLHLNRGREAVLSEPASPAQKAAPAQFSEIGRMAGIEATDWSWGAMIGDFDLDGERDLFVANGIFQDLTNADYLVEIRDERTMSELIGENYVDFERLIDMIPSNPISNYMFAGRADLRFVDVTAEWGMSQPGFSNGSAYGDLDNDGDLDLVVNNVNMGPFVYRNRATEMAPGRAWLQVELKGPSPNTQAVGAQLTAWSGGRQWYVEQQPVRGFQSTVDHTLHIGLGTSLDEHGLDSLVVRWPDGRVSRMTDVAVNRRLRLEHPRGDGIEMLTGDSREAALAGDTREVPLGDGAEDPTPVRFATAVAGSSATTERHADTTPGSAAAAARSTQTRQDPRSLRSALERADSESFGFGWQHRENDYSDFDRQPLLFHMRSTEGPALCTGDANGDGRTDVYLGGARDQAGAVFVQTAAGRFDRKVQPALESNRVSEDTACVWFDADGDGDDDLYVGSGSSEFPASSSALMDRLYLNDGSGRLERSEQLMISAMAGFEPTGAVAASDYDGDGDVDLFVGARLRPFAVGIPADGHLLLNDGLGNFREATDDAAEGMRDLGLITDAKWADVDGDGDVDLVVVGEWMPLTVFDNQGGVLVKLDDPNGLQATSGWWNAVELVDLDADGDLDLIGANHGLNSRFRASPEEPLHMWVDDFDRNGSVEQVHAMFRDGQLYPMALRHDLIEQIPRLEDAYPSYESFAGETISDIFSEEELQDAAHHEAELLESVVGWNDGAGQFRIEPLPMEAQLAPMYAIEVADINEDGTSEILMGGNLYEAKPEVGRYDASFGVVLATDSSSLSTVPATQSGLWVTGPVRRIAALDTGPRRVLLVARNNDSLNVFTYGD